MTLPVIGSLGRDPRGEIVVGVPREVGPGGDYYGV